MEILEDLYFVIGFFKRFALAAIKKLTFNVKGIAKVQSTIICRDLSIASSFLT